MHIKKTAVQWRYNFNTVTTLKYMQVVNVNQDHVNQDAQYYFTSISFIMYPLVSHLECNNCMPYCLNHEKPHTLIWLLINLD